MFSLLKGVLQLASLAKLAMTWLKERSIFNHGRKEQQRVNLKGHSERVERANEIRNERTTVDDDLDLLRGDTKSSNK
jgi:hypothetical protein